jgi:hypothetical protein
MEASIHIFPTMEFKHSAHLSTVSIYLAGFQVIKMSETMLLIIPDVGGAFFAPLIAIGILPTIEVCRQLAYILNVP